MILIYFPDHKAHIFCSGKLQYYPFNMEGGPDTSAFDENIPKASKITLFNTQNVMEVRLAKLYYFEATELKNDIEISSLALVFELHLWSEISLLFQLNIRSPSSKVGNTLSGCRNSHTMMKSRDWLSLLQVFVM